MKLSSGTEMITPNGLVTKLVVTPGLVQKRMVAKGQQLLNGTQNETLT